MCRITGHEGSVFGWNVWSIPENTVQERLPLILFGHEGVLFVQQQKQHYSSRPTVNLYKHTQRIAKVQNQELAVVIFI